MKRFEKEYNITPISYSFPDDLESFEQDRAQEDHNSLYILKPVAASCGRGIKIIGNKTPIVKKTGYLACKYIA
jgi:glutathionylspermidine synthase